MANTKKNIPAKSSEADKAQPTVSLPEKVRAILAWLEKASTQRDRENLTRFAITASKFFGVSMANMKPYAKRLGRDRELAAGLWETGWYEARMLAALIDEPGRVTPAQMNRWCVDFDNWAICDTVCFHLFDRTPHGFRKVAAWSDRPEEFVKRGAFALLASLALHDKQAEDGPFLESLILVERAANDGRNFVKKAVNWALRAVGERNSTLHAAALTVARRLAESEQTAARWVGKDALRKLTGPVVMKRLAAKLAKKRLH